MTHRSRRRPLPTASFLIDVVRCFYGRPIAWVALFVSSAFLTYGGGAVMFWFHAIVRGEAGPAIQNVHHWLLDSTLGFIALTPVLGLILPLAVWHAGGATEPRSTVRLWVYVAATATIFTVFTGPGPLLHDAVAGAGTPLARIATRIFGEDSGAVTHGMHASSRSPVTEGFLQLCVGFPAYLACTWLALGFVRGCARASRHGTGALRRTKMLTGGETSVPGF